MTLEPIIASKLEAFKRNYSLSNNIDDGKAFEMFVNKEILVTHQPNAFDTSHELLESVCVGGGQDGGMDGICVKIDGLLVSTEKEVEDIFSTGKKVEVEFIFIQSKYKNSFSATEYGKFISGVRDFMGEKHYSPFNDEIKYWLGIKDVAYKYVAKWKDGAPLVRLYYVSTGKWYEDANIIGISNQFKEDMSNSATYREINIRYIDRTAFLNICNENENAFSITIPYIEIRKLEATDAVDDFVMCSFAATDFLQLLTSEEGMLRKNLFDDNVRDYQGGTNVNTEILSTIKTSPELFALYNNGITIVCQGLSDAKRSVTIESPQIVNGCQTCNTLFIAYKDGYNLSKIVINAKLIATSDDELINGIVRGNNKQNIVQDEAFETITNFHKGLEDFFRAQSDSHSQFPLFYERRSKQYSAIEAYKKVNFSTLLKSFVGIFLEKPHDSFQRHQFTLLREYKTKIFTEGQSYLPYYTAARLYSFVDQVVSKSEINLTMRKLKIHIAFTFALMIAGKPCDINREKDIDKYCNILLDKLFSNERVSAIREAANKLKSVIDIWVQEKGENYRSAINDRSDFTDLLKSCILNTKAEQTATRSRGIVEKVGVDRYNQYYGFISSGDDNIFFHSNSNPQLDYRNLEGQTVVFDVEKTPKTFEGIHATRISIL